MNELSSADQLRNLLQRYARAADDRDAAALAELFSDDAVVLGARGEQSIAEWLGMMRGPRPFPASMHLLGDPLIELRDDGTARLDTYAIVHQIGDPDVGQKDLRLGVRYLDEVVPVDGGGWKIKHRTATTLFMN